MATTIAETASTFPVDSWDVVGDVQRSIALTSFFGGAGVGKALQVTVGGSFVPLTRPNVARVLEALRLWMADVDSERIPRLLEQRDARLETRGVGYDFLPGSFNLSNVFGVGRTIPGVADVARGEAPGVRVLFARQLAATELTDDQALTFAAWIVAIVGNGARERFDAILARIERT